MFQSYLIYGEKDSRRKETLRLAKTFGLSLDKSSVDIFIISPSQNLPGTVPGHISIDQIRDLKRHIFQKPLSLPFKFTIIEYAEKLTIEAQNALLKILEEPPRQAIIVLEAKNKQDLLPTIRSRVLTKDASSRKIKTPINLSILEDEDLVKTFEKTADLENPIEWLDSQIMALYETIVSQIASSKKPDALLQLSSIIEKCIKTKKMIEAKVNPKFAIADLILSVKSKQLTSLAAETASK